MHGSRHPDSQQPHHTCRRCGGRLQRGYAQIHGTFGGFLMVGLSYTHLFFSPDSDPPMESVVLFWKERHVAFKCLGCGAFIVTPHTWNRSV